MQHLTRIVAFPVGMNILGLMEFLVVLAWFTLIISSFEMPSWVGGSCLLGGLLMIMLFDLGWRLRQPEASRVIRLISPYTGGCIVYIPLWLFLPLMPAITTISAIIIQRFSR